VAAWWVRPEIKAGGERGGEAGPGLAAVGAGPGGGGRRAWRKRAWARNKAGGVARAQRGGERRWARGLAAGGTEPGVAAVGAGHKYKKQNRVTSVAI
jgi:hypothetical protein